MTPSSPDPPPLRLAVPGRPLPGDPVPAWLAAGGATRQAAAAAPDPFLPEGLVWVRGAFDLTPPARGGDAQGEAPGEVELELLPGQALLLELDDGATAVLAPGALAGRGAGARGLPLAGAFRRVVRLFVLELDPDLLDPLLREAREQALGWARRRLGEERAGRIWDLAERGLSWCAMRGLVHAIERRIGEPAGLVRWGGGPAGVPDAPPAAAEQPLLLFLHGLGSSCAATFADLSASAPDDWQRLQDLYGERMLAFDHPTLSVGPIGNALALVRALPGGARLHLVAHSSGGLIGDLLCLGAVPEERIEAFRRRPPDPGEEADPRRRERLIESLREVDAEQRGQLTELLGLLREKNLRIERYLRVAAPARGTRLVGSHLDVFLSALLGLIGAVPLLAAGPVPAALRRLLLEMVRLRADPRLVPGLEALLPDGPLAAFLAEAPAAAGRMAVVAGDQEGGSPATRLLQLLHDAAAFQGVPNDGVVDTDSMDGGIALSLPHDHLLRSGPGIGHFRYFADPATRAAVLGWLLQPEPPAVFAAVPASRPAPRTGAVPPRERETVLRVICRAGDVRFVADPVLVGHYEDDAIAGPESIIDRQLVDAQLSIHHQLGIHAGPRGSSTVVLPEPNAEERRRGTSRGAVVIGLGPMGELTAQHLTEAVRVGTLRYLLRVRDRCSAETQAGSPYEAGLATLLIGTNSSALSPITIEDSLAAILRGVLTANRQFGEVDPQRTVRVGRLEVVEIHLDSALTAVRALRDGLGERLNREFAEAGLRVEAEAVLRTDGTHRQRLDAAAAQGYWTRFVITPEPDSGMLRFVRLGQLAKATSNQQQQQPGLVESLVENAIHRRAYNADLARALFHLLIPHAFKDHLRQAERMVLVLEGRSADLPWEMLREGENEQPLCVQHHMVRQLQSVGPDRPRSRALANTAFVVGNPSTDGFERVFATAAPPSLPAAELEAGSVARLLRARGWDVEQSIGAGDRAVDIVEKMYRRPFRLVHIAAHGILDAPTKAGDRRSGVVLSDGSLITAVEVCSLEQAPDLVFLSCCHLARVDGGGDAGAGGVPYNRLAASLASELIANGVRVVLAAGWAVDDAAAGLFTDTFYRELLANRPFGDAVHQARVRTWREHGTTTTWGAFQAYGDPAFVLDPSPTALGRGASHGIPPRFVHPEELLQGLRELEVDLHVPSLAPGEAESGRPPPAARLEALLERGDPQWRSQPQVAVAIADVYREMGQAHAEPARRWYATALGAEPPGALERQADLESHLGLERWEQGQAGGEELLNAALRKLERWDRLVAASTDDGPGGAARRGLLAGAWLRRSVLLAQRLASQAAGEEGPPPSLARSFTSSLERTIALCRQAGDDPCTRLDGLLLEAIASLPQPPDERDRAQLRRNRAAIHDCCRSVLGEHRRSFGFQEALLPAYGLLIRHLLDRSLPAARD
ncbi:MAG: CHAT domain-containing protein, partial [Synechococcaceae cyanobacterium]|nr:CHAT domain-containing protein [Synechococcaceae cyanobacterium]